MTDDFTLLVTLVVGKLSDRLENVGRAEEKLAIFKKLKKKKTLIRKTRRFVL